MTVLDLSFMGAPLALLVSITLGLFWSLFGGTLVGWVVSGRLNSPWVIFWSVFGAIIAWSIVSVTSTLVLNQYLERAVVRRYDLLPPGFFSFVNSGMVAAPVVGAAGGAVVFWYRQRIR